MAAATSLEAAVNRTQTAFPRVDTATKIVIETGFRSGLPLQPNGPSAAQALTLRFLFLAFFLAAPFVLLGLIKTSEI